MLLADLKDKRILIWGMGKEGQACLDYFQKHNLSTTIATYNDEDGPEKFAELLKNTEVIVKSPGVSVYREEIVRAKGQGIAVTSSSDLFLNEMRVNHPRTKVIGISGSKGKSTSVSMLYHMLKALGVRAALGGNIGKALIDLADTDDDVVVGEFSSYQAADLTASPHIVMFTNLFFVHSDWHHGHDNYCKDKLHLAANQKPGDLCLVNARNPQLRQYCQGIGRKEFYNLPEGFHAEGKDLFYKNDKILSINELKLCGDHNMENLAGVMTIVQKLGLDVRAAAASLKSFEPLPHRLQKVTVKKGVLFINDSISTAPEAAISAIKSFDDTMAVISGGIKNGQDYTEYAKCIEENPKVKLVITLFQSGPEIAAAIRKYVTRKDFKLIEVETLNEAVSKAYEEMKRCGGTLVLFSPTAPSFGYYKNFMERGQDFIDNVNKLP